MLPVTTRTTVGRRGAWTTVRSSKSSSEAPGLAGGGAAWRFRGACGGGRREGREGAGGGAPGGGGGAGRRPGIGAKVPRFPPPNELKGGSELGLQRARVGLVVVDEDAARPGEYL